MTPSEILRAAAELIGKPGAWTQDTYARAADGREVSSVEDQAVCWCLHGAVRSVAIRHAGITTPTPTPESVHAVLALAKACAPAEKHPGTIAIHNFNDADGRTQADCVAKLLEAAELADKAP